MHTLEVSLLFDVYMHVTVFCFHLNVNPLCLYLQGVGHTAMPTLVLEVGQFSWMMFSAVQVLTSY